MQIQKLEEEFEIKIFDRRKQPITATPAGLEIIEHARNVVNAAHELSSLVESQKGKMRGNFALALFLRWLLTCYLCLCLLLQKITRE